MTQIASTSSTTLTVICTKHHVHAQPQQISLWWSTPKNIAEETIVYQQTVDTLFNPVLINAGVRLAVEKLRLAITVVVVMGDAISIHLHHAVIMEIIILFGIIKIMQHSQTNMFLIEVQKERSLLYSRDHIIWAPVQINAKPTLLVESFQSNRTLVSSMTNVLTQAQAPPSLITTREWIVSLLTDVLLIQTLSQTQAPTAGTLLKKIMLQQGKTPLSKFQISNIQMLTVHGCSMN